MFHLVFWRFTLFHLHSKITKRSIIKRTYREQEYTALSWSVIIVGEHGHEAGGSWPAAAAGGGEGQTTAAVPATCGPAATEPATPSQGGSLR